MTSNGREKACMHMTENAHNDNEFNFTSGIPYTDMVGECNRSYVTNIRIVRVEPNIKLRFNLAQNAGPGANTDRFCAYQYQARTHRENIGNRSYIPTRVQQRAY